MALGFGAYSQCSAPPAFLLTTFGLAMQVSHPADCSGMLAGADFDSRRRFQPRDDSKTEKPKNKTSEVWVCFKILDASRIPTSPSRNESQGSGGDEGSGGACRRTKGGVSRHIPQEGEDVGGVVVRRLRRLRCCAVRRLRPPPRWAPRQQHRAVRFFKHRAVRL